MKKAISLIMVLCLIFTAIPFAVSAAEGAKFSAVMNDFAKTITELGENRRLEDLRCKD